MSVKIDVISGFLGAGKTTMIKKLLDGGVLGTQIAIIENEFGDISIDSDRLNNSEFSVEIKSISSGCICCTLAGEFDLAIKELIKSHNPDRIVVEPTGVGKLSDILFTINRVQEYEDTELNVVMTIVDVCEFEDFIGVFGDFFTDQIENATTIALSKTQLTDESKIDRVISSIRKTNDAGNIIATPWDRLDAGYILGIAESNKKVTTNDEINICCGHKHGGNFIHEQVGQEQFEFYSFETMKKYEETKLKEILYTLNDPMYGEVLRAKGAVLNNEGKWIDLDFTPGKTNITAGNTNIIGKIIVIGKRLNKDVIRDLLKQTK
ncbi:MAG TPA: GTP-binding protein [Oscillospiraceae bacterium]|nr:GTP-binding protein [Oscillospiraceae bacterium]